MYVRKYIHVSMFVCRYTVLLHNELPIYLDLIAVKKWSSIWLIGLTSWSSRVLGYKWWVPVLQLICCIFNTNNLMVPLKCNVALAHEYFPQILILDAFLSTSTCIISMRVEAGVENLIGWAQSLEGVFALLLEWLIWVVCCSWITHSS